MMKADPDICVCNPITEDYTTFEILVKTKNPAFSLRHSRTRRRYNDFCWLRKTIRKHHPLCTCPELPEKKKFSDRFEIQFLVKRMKELEEWLQSILSISLFLSDTTVHLFLQSTLTCKQIEQYLNGKLPESQYKMAVQEAEMHVDTSVDSEDNEEDDQDNDKGSELRVGASAGQSSPLEIRTRPSRGLHTDTQDRSDSGIAEFDSEAESSYDSQGSPYVSSLDSGAVPEKYPPLTEIGSLSLNTNPLKDASSKSDADEYSTDVKSARSYNEVSSKSKLKVNTVTAEEICDSHVQFDYERRKILPQSEAKKLEQQSRDSEKNTNDMKTADKNDSDGKASSVTHKVQMGVLFC